METIEIYKKEGMGRTKKECEEKELLRTQQEIESLKQWQEYYKSSGLLGQAALFEDKARNLRRKILLIEKGVPYPTISREQLAVLNSVFNLCVPAEEFSAQSMPPDVVKSYLEAKEYKGVGIFESIKVAYYDDDPILIGKSVNEKTGLVRHYLLARWGDGLKPWEWFMNHYRNEKRARIAPLRHTIHMLIASLFLIASYFLLPAPEAFDAVKPFLLSLGVGFLAVSAWTLIARFKAQKSYSRLLSEPIPSPFAT